MPNATPANCPVPVPLWPCDRPRVRTRTPVHRHCNGAPWWRRPDGVWFCLAHSHGHVQLIDAAGRSLGWWRVEREPRREHFWLHDDRHLGRVVFVFPRADGLWSTAGASFENDYGPNALAAMLAPAVRWATST